MNNLKSRTNQWIIPYKHCPSATYTYFLIQCCFLLQGQNWLIHSFTLLLSLPSMCCWPPHERLHRLHIYATYSWLTSVWLENTIFHRKCSLEQVALPSQECQGENMLMKNEINFPILIVCFSNGMINTGTQWNGQSLKTSRNISTHF